MTQKADTLNAQLGAVMTSRSRTLLKAAMVQARAAAPDGYRCGSLSRRAKAGRFLGELNLLTGQTVFVTAVVREPGEVLVVPVERLRQLVTRDPALGDLILRAYLLRRSLLIELGTGFRIVGSRFVLDTRRLREGTTTDSSSAAPSSRPRRTADGRPVALHSCLRPAGRASSQQETSEADR